MPDQTVIKFDPEGDPLKGLQPWDPIPADQLQSGNPVQNGHFYFDTDNSRLTSGVWDCTPHELVSGPYLVDEFMIVLEGSIIIEHETRGPKTFRAGDCFIVPRGTPCTWRQDEYALKYFVIHDNSESPVQKDSNLNALLVDPDADLSQVTQHDPGLYESAVPDMGLLLRYRDPSGRFQAGVWDCSPMKRVATTIERSELMHIIEGSGSITNADGVVFNFQAGDTFLVPVGMGYQWQNDEYVKKTFCSYTP